MARSKSEEKEVVVRKYGLLEPLDWGEDCREVLFLQNCMWNSLVELEKEHRIKYRELCSQDQDVQTLEEQMQGLKNYKEDLRTRRNALRKEKRKKTDPELSFFDQELKNIQEQIKELSPEIKEARKASRQKIKAELDDLEQQRRAAAKEIYQDSGLWWGNYNAILDSYNTARIRAMKEGTELRFHRFEGAGRFSMQIQGGISVQELFNQGSNICRLNVLRPDEFQSIVSPNNPNPQLPDSRKNKKTYGLLKATIYTDRDMDNALFRRYLTFPIILHRDIPEDVQIKSVCIHRRKQGRRFTWSVSFTCTRPKQEIENTNPATGAVNFGWKKVDGHLRVATVRSETGQVEHITLPPRLMQRLDYVQKLQTRADNLTNETFATMLQWREEQSSARLPEALQEQLDKLARAKRPHPRQLQRLLTCWQHEAPKLDPDTMDILIEACKQLTSINEEKVNLERKTRGWREDIYRNKAKEIAEQFGTIYLDDTNYAQAAKLETRDGTNNPLHQQARNQRQRAAVSTLREWINKQAAKTGSRIVRLNDKYTRTCNVCGYVIEERPSSLLFCCPKCKNSTDQDDNACINMLRTNPNQTQAEARA